MNELFIMDCTIVFFLAIYCILLLPNTVILTTLSRFSVTNIKKIQKVLFYKLTI